MASQKKNNKGLSELEERFIGIYMNNGMVGTNAYLLASPGCSQETATANASRLLRNANVTTEIELRKLKIRNEEDIQLSFIVKNLKNIIFDITANESIEKNAEGITVNKPDRGNMIKALALLSKIAGFETQKVDVTIQGPIDISKLINFDDNDK